MAGADVCLNLDELGQLAAHLEALKRIADSQNRLLADRTLLQFQSAHDPLLGNLLNYSAILARLELQIKSATQRPELPIVVEARRGWRSWLAKSRQAR